MNYELAYRVGFHPWEDAEDQPRFRAKLSELFTGEEQAWNRPYGRALDLGTGSGIWGVELARRGWQVVGVDIVERALERARVRAVEAGVEIELVRGDVTGLQRAGVGTGFRLVLDTGTFHGLRAEQRVRMGSEVTAVAAEDATVLLLAWQPRRRGPLPHGASDEEIREAFAGWAVSDVGPSEFSAPKPVDLLFRPGERWFRLHRE